MARPCGWTSDQLPGVCRDYFTVQGWIDFNDGAAGVTVALPDNPMAQFGGFNFGQNQATVKLGDATLLGWVTNNYWETNFPAYQPGAVTARYRLLPYEGSFDEARANRLASEAAHSRPLVQHTGETPARQLLPPSGTLLRLPEPPVLVLGLAPAGAALTLTLMNASDQPQPVAVRPGLLRLARAWACDLFGRPVEELAVTGGGVDATLDVRRLLTLRLETEPVRSEGD